MPIIGMTKKDNDACYILITQCLQNDFFLNRGCKLRLPESEVKKILVGKEGPDPEEEKNSICLKLGRGYPKNGPLGIFLRAVIGNGRQEIRNDNQGILHVINIRDWHKPSKEYGKERCQYGEHCDADTWGSEYIAGLEDYLDLDMSTDENTRIRIHHVRSDSVFDFNPYAKTTPANSLEGILNGIFEDAKGKIKHVAVIGVYTDIKVKTLLMGLCSRYRSEDLCLAVSDTLTASTNLERHLGALDFAQKVLGVEIIHGLSDLVHFLGGKEEAEIYKGLDIVATDRFSKYASYFQDKQNVLAYEDTKLKEYLDLTKKRSEDVYKKIKFGNTWLLRFGIFMLLLILVLTVLNVYLGIRHPDKTFDWKLMLVPGGISLLQLVSTFFWRPMADLQRNLTNLATFRIILENQSFKSALARFHLTTPQLLHDDIGTDIKADAVKMQVKAFSEQIEVLTDMEKNVYETLKELGFGAEETARGILKGKS